MLSKIIFTLLLVAFFLGAINLYYGVFEIDYLLFFVLGLVFLYREHLLMQQNKKLSVLQEELLELNVSLNQRVQRATADLEDAQHLANIGSWVFYPEYKKLEWSKQAYEILGLKETTDANPFDIMMELVHPKDLERVQNEYYNSLEKKEGRTLEHRLLLKDGNVKYIIDTYEHRYDENGDVLMSYGVIQDVTARALLEQELEKKDADLMHKSRLAQMGETLSMISHQWRQPLATISAKQISILMALDLEQYDLKQEDQRAEFILFLRKNIELMGEHVQNLSQIISNFSNFYRPHKELEVHVINDVIVQAFNMVKERFVRKEISIRIGLNSYYEVEIYDNEFMQVILNILFNAKEQFLEKKIKNPLVEIVSYDKDGYVYVEISDNAGGIDNAIMQKIFDPYVSTKLEKNGSGLGLYMSKSIIEKHHGGKIYASNTKEGARFTIKLKRYKEV